jgi:hypothetical protein
MCPLQGRLRDSIGGAGNIHSWIAARLSGHREVRSADWKKQKKQLALLVSVSQLSWQYHEGGCIIRDPCRGSKGYICPSLSLVDMAVHFPGVVHSKFSNMVHTKGPRLAQANACEPSTVILGRHPEVKVRLT